jgi:FKBP-type peptidyl-prolyl cis-trans isomerase (trigger factor)
VTTAASDLSVFVERKPGWIVELTVEAPAAELDRALTEAGRKLGARIRIPGFRPGKAPAGLVERAVGWEALRNAAAEELVPRLYGRAVEQEDLDPVGDPSVTLGTVERGQPVKFTAEVAVRPVVDLADYRSLRVDRPHTEIGEAEVDSALEEVRRRFSDLADVSRPAQAGDVLRCTLVMRRGEEVLSGGEERDLELDRERPAAVPPLPPRRLPAGGASWGDRGGGRPHPPDPRARASAPGRRARRARRRSGDAGADA